MDEQLENILSDFIFEESCFYNLGAFVSLPQSLGEYLPEIAALLLATKPPFEEKIKLLVQSLRQEQNLNKRILFSVYTSTIIREIRHFHDNLASPYGDAVMQNQLQMVHYTYPILTDLIRQKLIILPIKKWSTLTVEQCKSYVDIVKENNLNHRPPKIWINLSEHIENALNKISILNEKPFSYPLEFTTRHLIKSIGLETQLVQLANFLEPQMFTNFLKFLCKKDDNRLHSTMHNIWNSIPNRFSKPICITPTVRNALTFYSLCAISESEPPVDLSHPTERLLALIGFMIEEDNIPDDDGVMPFLDRFAKSTGCLSLRQNLQRSLKKSINFCNKLRYLATGTAASIGRPVLGDLHRSYSLWVKAREQMIIEILKDPIMYFNPTEYIRNFEKWVSIPFYLSISPNSLALDCELIRQFNDNGWKLMWGWEYILGEMNKREAEYSIGYGPELTMGKRFLSSEESTELTLPIWCSYLIWSPELLKPVFRNVATAYLEKTAELAGNPQLHIMCWVPTLYT